MLTIVQPGDLIQVLQDLYDSFHQHTWSNHVGELRFGANVSYCKS